MGVWYRAGTVAVTSGSKTVTGTGTQWQNLIFGVAPGVTFYGPDGKPYEIDTVNSNTSLTLATNYSGATASGQAYAIDPTRSGSVASLAAQTSEVLKFSQGQFTQIQNWFTGAASADVTLTSPAGQQITVPSYSKVTSEGEGQAARAKTEADKAAASAALAGDIVVASALPLPDVWAPLSDSLRMITGYGRDVLVGSDVVARMVNFSRSTTATYIGKDGQLKTAAVNEPRFEKEGLLIEGQSTNFIPWSADLSRWGRNAAPVLEMQPNGYTKVTPTDGNSGCYVVLSSLVVGAAYTLSFWGYAEKDISSVAIGSEVDWKYVTALTTKPTRFTVSFIAIQADVAIVCYGGRYNSNDPFYVKDFQLEALPFASSYIPTNGAAATRAADRMTGPGPGNIPVNAPFSLAAEISVTPVVGVYPVVISMGGLKLEMAEPVAGSQRIVPFMNGNPDGPWLQGNDLFGGGKVLAIACDSSGMLLRYGDKTSAGIGGHIESIGDIDVSYIGVCHIRNFRIWHRALTDEQIKGIG